MFKANTTKYSIMSLTSFSLSEANLFKDSNVALLIQTGLQPDLFIKGSSKSHKVFTLTSFHYKEYVKLYYDFTKTYNNLDKRPYRYGKKKEGTR